MKAPEGKGCPRCGGFVYHADQIFSKGNVWHKGRVDRIICEQEPRLICVEISSLSLFQISLFQILIFQLIIVYHSAIIIPMLIIPAIII